MSVAVRCYRCNTGRVIDQRATAFVPAIGCRVWMCKTCKADNYLRLREAMRLCA
jgi:hypothetical protein